MNKALIEKVQKLLALANSSNENEAKLASSMAQDLMLKHNISVATVENAQFEFTEHLEDLKKRNPVEEKFISTILKDYFFVRVIHNKIINKLQFIGTEENLQVALYVRAFLNHSFQSLYRAENQKRGWGGKHRNAFYFGLYKGLKEQLEKAKVKAQADATSSKALIVIDRALETHINKQVGKLKHSNSNINVSNRDAVARGHAHGVNMRIARGLGEKSNKGPLVLNGKGGTK